MNSDLQVIFHATLIYKPEIHERVPSIVKHLEELAAKHDVLPKITFQFHTEPRSQWNKKPTYDYFENASESLVVSVLFVEPDLRKLDDEEWTAKVSAYDRMLNTFRKELQKFVFYFK
jgi:hypothetical protein